MYFGRTRIFLDHPEGHTVIVFFFYCLCTEKPLVITVYCFGRHKIRKRLPHRIMQHFRVKLTLVFFSPPVTGPRVSILFTSTVGVISLVIIYRDALATL